MLPPRGESCGGNRKALLAKERRCRSMSLSFNVRKIRTKQTDQQTMFTKYPSALILVLAALLAACEKPQKTKNPPPIEAPSKQPSETSSKAPREIHTKLAGLSLALPGQPQRAEFGLSKSSKDNTKSQESYIVQNGTTQYGLCQTVHYSMNDSLDDNARGIVEGHEKYSIVDLQISGVSGKRITMDFTADQNTHHVSVIVFSKGNTLWQIATIDPSMTKAHGAMDALISSITILE